MPIKKITDFVQHLKNGSVLLSAGPDGVSDAIPEMSVSYIELQPGQEVKPHTHNRTEVYLFLTGRAKVMTGHEVREIATGDVAIAPNGTPHAIKVIGNEPLRFYAFNSPPASSCPMVGAPEEYLWKWNRGL
ncbi:cupin domain-containing protein [bacterium]|nr:cupin domain-containing protein [bacterium]